MPRSDDRSGVETEACPLCRGTGTGTDSDGLCPLCGGSGVVKVGKSTRRAASMASPGRIRSRPADPGMSEVTREARQHQLLSQMEQTIRQLEGADDSPAIPATLRALRVQVEHLRDHPKDRTRAAARSMERALREAQQVFADGGLTGVAGMRTEEAFTQLTEMLAELLGLAHVGR